MSTTSGLTAAQRRPVHGGYPEACHAKPMEGGRETEAKAWEWLDKTYSDAHNDAVDRAYAADEMVDAFHAGAAQTAKPNPTGGER